MLHLKQFMRGVVVIVGVGLVMLAFGCVDQPTQDFSTSGATDDPGDSAWGMDLIPNDSVTPRDIYWASDDYEDVDPNNMVGVFYDSVDANGKAWPVRLDAEQAQMKYDYYGVRVNNCYIVLWCYHCGLGGKYIRQIVPCPRERPRGPRTVTNPGGNKMAVPDSGK